VNIDVERYRLALISEWMDHGNINEFVKGREGVNRAQLVSDGAASCGSQSELLIQLLDVANGLEYMHSIHIVHGDLKGVRFHRWSNTQPLIANGQANILINRSLRACLADFGLSTIISSEHHAAANASLTSVTSKASLASFTAGGTLRWTSPELLDPDRFGISDSDCRPTKQSDCYAFGMVVYEVCVRLRLFQFSQGFNITSGSLRRSSILGDQG